MKRYLVVSLFFGIGVIGAASVSLTAWTQGAGGGGAASAQAAREQQLALEAKTPQLQIVEEHLTLTVPGHTVGETEGVSMNSKGHLFVYSRTGTSGSARGGT